jgi:hypothetical protein
MEIKTEQGRTFKGSPKEIVLKMSREDFMCHSKAEYTEEVKEKIDLIYGKKIEFSTHEEFLRELKRLKIINIIGMLI